MRKSWRQEFKVCVCAVIYINTKSSQVSRLSHAKKFASKRAELNTHITAHLRGVLAGLFQKQ